MYNEPVPKLTTLTKSLRPFFCFFLSTIAARTLRPQKPCGWRSTCCKYSKWAQAAILSHHVLSSSAMILLNWNHKSRKVEKLYLVGSVQHDIFLHSVNQQRIAMWNLIQPRFTFCCCFSIRAVHARRDAPHRPSFLLPASHGANVRLPTTAAIVNLYTGNQPNDQHGDLHSTSAWSRYTVLAFVYS